MNTKTHISTAERFGCWLGRGWQGCVRGERQVRGWLFAQGVSGGAASVLLWIAKLAVLGVLLYAAFWLALLILIAVVAARAARNADWETPEPEWQNGPAGFGLYTHDGFRIDPHVSDND